MLALSLGLVVTSVLVYAAFALGGARGYGPLAGSSSAPAGPSPAPATDPAGHAIEAPSPPPDGGCVRVGDGVAVALALACVAIIPIVVYVPSYWPWVQLGNLWSAGFPADHTGTDTFLALQQRMYDYHNNLRATHAASSPWWAWPFDFKPVWFYLGNLAEGWTALTYDAGNLVLFWLSVPAMAWTAAMAWRRRSLPLALILIGFACQWLPWARIDRATFQYHYYTSLPFVILALAYFLAELWHGPSARTWLVARLAAAGALVAVPLLWLMRVPLCATWAWPRSIPARRPVVTSARPSCSPSAWRSRWSSSWSASWCCSGRRVRWACVAGDRRSKATPRAGCRRDRYGCW